MKSDIRINKFLKVMIATQRAKQIRKGARALVQSSSTRATRIAIEEVEQGLIGFEFLPEDPDLKNGRADRAARGRDDIVEDNRDVTNQPSVASYTSVVTLGD
jgi:DNA-directed RNA polymerase omega subunit